MKEKTIHSPSDEELNVYIRTRYQLLGVDISVLPDSDPDAPMDQERLLENGRSILRQEVVAADFDIDPQFNRSFTVCGSRATGNIRRGGGCGKYSFAPNSVPGWSPTLVSPTTQCC